MPSRRALIRGSSAMAAGLLTVSVGRVLQTLASAQPSDGPYGRLLAPDANGIRLPAGFVSRIIARTGQVVGATGYVWHGWPDGGACFPLANRRHAYVSNSELDAGTGGVSAVVFDVDGEVTDAYRICSGTTRNCAGGATPWGTWMSGEEFDLGQIYECDPTGQTAAVARPLLGKFRHEAGAVDPATGIVYLTEDQPDGRLYRFVPETIGSLARGTLFAATVDGQHVGWAATSVNGPDREDTQPFNGGEGIVVRGNTLSSPRRGTSGSGASIWRQVNSMCCTTVWRPHQQHSTRSTTYASIRSPATCTSPRTAGISSCACSRRPRRAW